MTFKGPSQLKWIYDSVSAAFHWQKCKKWQSFLRHSAVLWNRHGLSHIYWEGGKCSRNLACQCLLELWISVLGALITWHQWYVLCGNGLVVGPDDLYGLFAASIILCHILFPALWTLLYLVCLPREIIPLWRQKRCMCWWPFVSFYMCMDALDALD